MRVMDKTAIVHWVELDRLMNKVQMRLCRVLA